ncbi:hypothetical protein SAMN05660766_0591 [Curtobacterium sp. 314Chir4.1]|uniref:hypothetical protein n=1 Tax=Curtobacterium sp. 314Chir4.1 TaxID=1279028 RepID=UPI000BD8339D|nr:hypothetical protein [Curtobacterium sp. 314Chir4.1]SOC86927.1 hypothetical protein SAMN05660766_0591 [Curtobacterium sp. 314Chir4.1]
MRISKREHLMALELERRALELLGDSAPAWALEDAGQLGPDVQVVDDEIQDVTEPEVGVEYSRAWSEEPSPGEAPGAVGAVMLAVALEDVLRAEGFDRASAYIGAAAAADPATAGDSFRDLTVRARSAASEYEQEHRRQVASGRFTKERAQRVQSALVGLGLSREDAAQSAATAVDEVPLDAGLSQLLTAALRDARRRGRINATARRVSRDEPAAYEGPEFIINGKAVRIPGSEPYLSAALMAFVSSEPDDAEEPGDRDDPPAPPVGT